MGDRNHIKYTTAERMSFQVVPETCPAIERAFEKAKRYKSDDWSEILAKYDIEANRKLIDAIHEIVGKATFMGLVGLQDVVLYEGTFKLRQALVEVMEDHLRTEGQEPEPSHFKGWIDGYHDRAARRII